MRSLAVWPVALSLLLACGAGGDGGVRDGGEPRIEVTIVDSGRRPSDGAIRAADAFADAESQMTWVFDNQCHTDVRVRLHDKTNGGGWPPEGGGWDLPARKRGMVIISCATGASICFGAVVQTDGGSAPVPWGIGLAGTGRCPDCCEPCAATEKVRELECS